MIQPSLLLSALVDLQYFLTEITGKMLVDSKVFRTLGNSIAIKEKIEWVVILFHRQERWE